MPSHTQKLNFVFCTEVNVPPGIGIGLCMSTAVIAEILLRMVIDGSRRNRSTKR
jgi:hypothetical protein